MHFAENKYTRWYFNIIYKAADVRTKGKTELHHVLPKSLYPEYKNLNKHNWNGVYLTAREHFICHWLLTKMCADRANMHKMVFAFKMMMHMNGNGQERYKVNSHVYQILRENLAQKLSDFKFTDTRIANMKKAAQNRANSLTDAERKKRSKCLIELNKKRKGEKRPYATGENNNMFKPGVIEKRTGENNHFYNKNHTLETKQILREIRLKEKWICPHCGKAGGGNANYKRWHGDNCKMKELANA